MLLFLAALGGRRLCVTVRNVLGGGGGGGTRGRQSGPTPSSSRTTSPHASTRRDGRVAVPTVEPETSRGAGSSGGGGGGWSDSEGDEHDTSAGVRQ